MKQLSFWKRISQTYVFVFLALFLAAAFSIYSVLTAQEVIIVDTNFRTDIQKTSQNLLVVVDDDVHYAFYGEFATSEDCYMTSTTDGGTTWSAAEFIIDDNCRAASVWYDQWTPGDQGTKIHFAHLEATNLYYVEIDTTDGSYSSSVNVSGAIDAATYNFWTTPISITKGTDGDLYITATDDEMESVVKCASGLDCTDGANWAAAGATSPLADDPDDVDKVRLMPLSGGDIMMIRHDDSASKLMSYIYDDSANTWGNTTTIYSNVVSTGLTYHDESHGALINATLDPDNNDIFVGFIKQNGTNAHSAGDALWTAKYSGGTWNTSTAPVIESTLGAGARMVMMTYDNANDEVYTFFSHGANDTTMNYYYKKSTDGMATWGATSTALADTNFSRFNSFGSANMVTDEMIYFYWGIDNGAEETLYGFEVADVQGNSVPTATAISPTQTAAGLVTVTTTITDLDLQETSIMVEHSVDNVVWASSTINSATDLGAEADGVTTSSGRISGIDTDVDGVIALSFDWDAGVDVPNTDDTSVYLRIYVSDAVATSAARTSNAFSVDTKDPTIPGDLSVSSTSTQSVVLNFGATTTDSGFLEYKIFYKAGTSSVSTEDTAFTSSSDANLGNINFNEATTTTITGLATSTQYVASLWAFDSFGRSASSSNEITFTTLATAVDAPTLSNQTSTTIDISFTENGNGSAARYAVYHPTTTRYIDALGAVSVPAVFQEFADWNGVTATGLIPNTAYAYSIVTKNTDGVRASTSSVSAVLYTNAAIPSINTTTVDSSSAITVEWTANNNPDGTEYLVQRVDDTDENSGWVTERSYQFTGLTAETAYSFQVQARNTDGVTTSLSVAVSATTDAAAQDSEEESNSGGGGGGGASIPAAQAQQIVTPQVQSQVDKNFPKPETKKIEVKEESEEVVKAGFIEATFQSPGSALNFVLENGETHKLRLDAVQGTIGFFTFFSEPISVQVQLGKEVFVDLDKDGIDDVLLVAKDFSGDSSRVEVTLLDSTAVTINDGKKYTDSWLVSLRMQSKKEGTEMIISEDPFFKNTAYQPYKQFLKFPLSREFGKKTVYVQLKEKNGTITRGQAQIEYVQELPVLCSLDAGKPYSVAGRKAVWVVTNKCTRRAFRSEQKYFSHFSSWGQVQTISANQLQQVPLDPVNFMPWGKNYDPKEEIVVKTIQSAKVYLLRNGKKHWITTEELFIRLGYQWHLIQDVEESFLEKYKSGADINNMEIYRTL